MSEQLQPKKPWPCNIVDLDGRNVQFVAQGQAGYLNATREGTNLYLTDMEVDRERRRMGIGRSLIGTAVSFAREEGMGRIVGDITSRPSLDVMRYHFGETALRVLVEEDYAVDDPDYVPGAVAFLEVDLTAEQFVWPEAS